MEKRQIDSATPKPPQPFDLAVLGLRAPVAVFKDATTELRSACAALDHGQMVAVPDFSLLDSMAAIKIMDARMDSGMLLPASEIPESDRLSSTSLDLEFDPFRQLDTADVIWIMDRLLGCETAWYQGSALSQTLYTCLYVHDIKALSPKSPAFDQGNIQSSQPELIFKVLRAYILSTIKTIDLIWNEVTIKQHIVDGEDFLSDKSGLSLLETTDPGYVVSQVDEALQWLESNIKDTSAAESLKARLYFRRQFLDAVCLLQDMGQASSLDVVMHCKFARRKLASLRPSPSEKVSLTRQPARIQPLHQPDRSLAPSAAARSAFDPAYNRKLVSTAPLRPISLPRAETTWKLIDEMLNELQEVVHVLHHPGFENWKIFLSNRSMMYQRLQPLSSTPYTRSLFQTVVCDRNMIAGRLPLEWLAEAFLQEVALIDPLVLRRASGIGRQVIEGGDSARWNAPPSLGQQLNFFTQRLAGNLVSYLSTLCQNRTRTKRQLGSQLYREWVMLSEEASGLGRLLEEQPDFVHDYVPDTLYAATQHVTLEIMTQITYSGLELELYANGIDREAMWWLGSRIQQEQCLVCTDLVQELSKRLSERPTLSHRRAGSTIAYLTRQKHLAAALESLSVSTLYLLRLFPSTASQGRGRTTRGTIGWPLDSDDPKDAHRQLARSVFSTRIKWMRLPSRASAFDTQVESLWSEYMTFVHHLRDQPRDQFVSTTVDCLTKAEGHLLSVVDGYNSQLEINVIHKDAFRFAQSLLTTTQQNLVSLQEKASAQDSASIPSWKFDNPWIPTLAFPV